MNIFACRKISTSFLVGVVSLFIYLFIYIFLCPSVNNTISSKLIRAIVMKLSGIIRVCLGRTEFKFFSARSKVKVTVITNIKNTFSAVTLSIMKISTYGLLHIEAWWNPMWVRDIGNDVTLTEVRQNRPWKQTFLHFRQIRLFRKNNYFRS